MSGYQEILTDPSYAGQVIAFTYPHIGNYGVTGSTTRRGRPFCRGMVVRDLADRPSNWRVDGRPRELPRPPRHRRHDRRRHPPAHPPRPRGRGDAVRLRDAPTRPSCSPRREPSRAPPGMDLVGEVTTPTPYDVAGSGRSRVVAYDFGMKTTILDHLGRDRHRRGRARPRRRPQRSSPAARRRLPLERPGRPGRARPPRRARSPAARRGPGLRDLPRPPAARRGARRHDLQAALRPPRRRTTRCGGSPPARSRSRARTTATPSPTATRRRRRRSPTST